MSERNYLTKLCCLAIALYYPTLVLGQQSPPSKRNTPIELQAADPQIRSLLEEARSDAENGDIDGAIANVTRGREIAVQKGLLGDTALAESALASGYIAKGKLDEGLRLLQKALQEAIDSGNLVLEADILTSLSTEAQIKGDWEGAIKIVQKAADRADEAHNLFEKSRALGELGRLQLLSGKTEEARVPIERALEIDQINQYESVALHMVYQGYCLIATGKLDASIERLKQAREKAIEYSDLRSFVLANSALAIVYVKEGKANEAIQILEFIRQGKLETINATPEMKRKFIAVLSVPFHRISLLEGLGGAYEAAGQPEKALAVWQDLYSLGASVGLLAARAESAKKVADLNAQLKKTQEALSAYATAVDLLRQVQNEPQLLQALISESLLLVQVGRGKEAIPLTEEIVELAKRRNMRSLQFSGYLEMAEIYQPIGDLVDARTALEKAQALIQPGPSDPEIDNKQLLEAYSRLGDIYREQQNNTKELIEAEKGVVIAGLLKDEKAEANLVAYIRRRFGEMKIYQLAQRAESEGRLEDALILSEIVVVFDGSPAKPGSDPNWNRVLDLPFQVVQRPQGLRVLTEILNEMGSFLSGPKYAILDALCQYYLGIGARPDLAEQFALQLDASLKDAGDSFLVLKATTACELTMAYAREGKGDLAKQKAPECLAMAERANQQQTKDFANMANVMAHVDDLENAEESLNQLIAKLPNAPELRVELATALGTRKLYRQAQSELERASQAYVAAGDKKSAAAGYARLAAALVSDVSDEGMRERMKCFETAGKLYREAGDVGGESTVEFGLGELYLGRKEYPMALEHLRKAYDLAQEARNNEAMALAQVDLGAVYQNLEKISEAAEYHKRACEAFHQMHNANLEAFSLAQLSRDERALQEPEKALSYSLEAKKVAAQNATVFTNYVIHLNLGLLYQQEGEFGKALAEFLGAEEVTKEGQDLEHLAYSHLMAGGLDELLGYWEDATSEGEMALGIFKKIHNKEGESTAYLELMNIYGDRTSSVKNFDRALGYYHEAEQLGYGPRLQSDLLDIYLQTGRYAEAVKVAQQGLKACSTNHYTDCEANALLSLAEAKRKSGDLKGARSDTQQARSLVAKSRDVYLQGRFLYGESRQERTERHFEAAFSSYRRLISLIETAKGQGDSRTQRGLAENYGFIYDELTSTLYSMYEGKKDPERFWLASQALEYAETNKARQFAESWGRAFISEGRRVLPAEAQETERSLFSNRLKIQSQLAARMSSSANATQNDTRQLEEDLSSVNAAIEAFVRDQRRSNPQYAAVAYPEPISIETLPLRSGETLVECKVTEDSTFVWIVRNENGERNELVSFYEVAKPRSWLLEQTSILRAALSGPTPEAIDWTISEQLFTALFPDKIAKEILQSREIVFVPDDVLFLLPFELLSPRASKGEFAFLNMPTRYYPSAAALRLGRSLKHPENWQAAFLGIGDPITSPEDDRYDVVGILSSEKRTSVAIDEKTAVQPKSGADLTKIRARGFSLDRLPGTATEIHEIAALFEAFHDTTEVRLGPDATKDKVLNTELAKFRFLHFATHGILPVDTDVKEPSLVLSYDGTDPERMLLSISEILALHIQADSVVLSACNTGSGKVSRAEGVMSLGRAFLSAGASSVVVSLWQVSDESTALFMEEFYRNLLAGKKKDAALTAARAFLFTHGYKQPYSWAPFILIGE